MPEERVPEDHPVHYIRQLVAEELDLSPIFDSGETARAHRPFIRQ